MSVCPSHLRTAAKFNPAYILQLRGNSIFASACFSKKLQYVFQPHLWVGEMLFVFRIEITMTSVVHEKRISDDILSNIPLLKVKLLR